MKPSEQKSINQNAGPATGVKYVIAGGTGFIGGALAEYLTNQGNDVTVLTRGPSREASPRPVHWDAIHPGSWVNELSGCYAIINLAGRSIDARHTPAIRNEILESRVQSVSVLNEAIRQVRNGPQVWLQASAIGYYGDRGSEELDEKSPPRSGILTEITEAWENEFAKATDIRKVTARFGVVLGSEGGAFPKLYKLARFFLGGSAGSGEHFLSWIHVDDLVRAVAHVCRAGEGTYNFTAPEPVTNRKFMEMLRRSLHRPWSPPVPTFAIHLGAKLMGTQPELILEGARVLPNRLLNEGFDFEYPTLELALKNLIVRK